MNDTPPPTANELFEERAERFYRETGMLAPGKDSRSGAYTYEERERKWIEWSALQSCAAPPCPNATPEWMVTELRKVALALHAEGWKGFAVRIGIVANAIEAAPSAPLPTVAPHLAGLVERLEQATRAIRSPTTIGYSWSAQGLPAITDAIDALTQLAGEVERLKAHYGSFYIGKRTLVDWDNELTDLRQKLAAASDNESALAMQLREAKLDADALAECLADAHLTDRGDKAERERVLAAHRARGAAGGKK